MTLTRTASTDAVTARGFGRLWTRKESFIWLSYARASRPPRKKIIELTFVPRGLAVLRPAAAELVHWFQWRLSPLRGRGGVWGAATISSRAARADKYVLNKGAKDCCKTEADVYRSAEPAVERAKPLFVCYCRFNTKYCGILVQRRCTKTTAKPPRPLRQFWLTSLNLPFPMFYLPPGTMLWSWKKSFVIIPNIS